MGRPPRAAPPTIPTPWAAGRTSETQERPSPPLAARPLLPPRTPPPGSPPRRRRESALDQVLPKAAASSAIATSATVPALVSSAARVAAPSPVSQAKIVDIASALSTARLGLQRAAWAVQGGWAAPLPRCAKPRGSGRPSRVAEGAGRTPDPAT